MKKMKLNSDNSQGFDITRASLIGRSLQNEIKFAFPYLNEQKIKDIIAKSEDNTETAKRIIKESNIQESTQNKNFVNMHQQNRKRRFDEMASSTHTLSRNTENVSVQNENLERKKFFARGPSQNANNKISDDDIERLMSDLDTKRSRNEIKDHLKVFCSSILEKGKNERNNNINENEKNNDIKKVNEDL